MAYTAQLSAFKNYKYELHAWLRCPRGVVTTALFLTQETRYNEIRVLVDWGEVQRRESGAAVEISLLLQKVEQPLERLEKGGSEWIDREKERVRENEREIGRRQRDRVPDIARYNENMAATWKSRMALNGSLVKVYIKFSLS